MNKELTIKQRRFYEYFGDKKNWKLKPPTFKECARFMEVKSDYSIWRIMRAIEAKGYILKGRKKNNFTLNSTNHEQS